VRCGDQRGADRRVGSQSGRPPLAQTERLKAALARYRRTGEDAERAETAAAYAGLLKYFETPARGAWRDKLKADGSWIEEPAPGSSMYHITCALAELMDAVEIDGRGS